MNTLDLEPQNLSERDLLISLITRFGYLEKELDDLKNDIVRRLDALEVRVGSVEAATQGTKGFMAGVDWLKNFLLALPIGGIYLIDKTQ